MTARLRKLFGDLSDSFWLLPALLVCIGILLAIWLVHLDRSGVVPAWLLEGGWLYNGGGTGARTLLGAVASSTIGVAGTVFSITIAALSLAAGQMGPRLLRNFVRDRGNQVTLGVFLATFSYALVVLRSVRTQDEGAFVPHLALGVGMLLAFLCVATLVYFVGHMAGRINVDTVVDLVAQDVSRGIERLTRTDASEGTAPGESFWVGAATVTDPRSGYLQHIDETGLASWAAEQGCVVRLYVRPGDHVFPGAPIAQVQPPHAEAAEAIRDATALGSVRVSSDDLEYAVRQLVEVAVRALSPGINDPHTAIGVIDRLGAALCEVAPRHLSSGVILHDGRPALVISSFDYAGLVDAMFHMIRQNGTRSTAVLIRLLEVLGAVASCERRPERLATLRRHADLVLADATRSLGNAQDQRDLRARHRAFGRASRPG